MKSILFFTMIVLLFSCERKNERPENISIQKNEIEMFFPEYYRSDTLFLDVQIDDCGEWGGPEDKFKIYRDSLRKIRLQHVRYKLNCDSLSYYYGKKKSIEYKRNIVISLEQQKQITEFFVYMMRAKIQEKGRSGHAASIYRLHNSDSTLVVDLASNNSTDEEKFYSFKKALKLPEGRRKAVEKVIVGVSEE